MTPYEKIKPHATLDDLFTTLEADKTPGDFLAWRYPVRFILLDDFCVFQQFVERAKAAGIATADLEKFLESSDDRDRWISGDEVRSVLRRNGSAPGLASGEDGDKSPLYKVISPCSEIIRFYDTHKFRAFLHDVALLEKASASASRIYIPLIGLRQRFEDFLTHFLRIRESPPVWAVGNGAAATFRVSPVLDGDVIENEITFDAGAGPVKIFLLPAAKDAGAFDLPDGFDCQKSFYEWLCFWKNHGSADRAFFSSEVLNAHYENARPDNIFQITKIENVHDFFGKVIGVTFPFEYKAVEDACWRRLLLENDWKARRSFQQFVAERFNIQKLTADTVIENWLKPERGDFDRWLLKNAAIEMLQTSQPYFCAVLARDVDLHNGGALLGRIALGVATGKLVDSVLEERRRLLGKFPPNVPLSLSDETALAELVDKMAAEDFETALRLCTGRFCLERERFIQWFKDGRLSQERLAVLYPGMAGYLSPLDDSNMADYFTAYKIAKLRDTYTPEIRTFMETSNASAETFWRWHSQYKSAHDLLAGEMGSLDKVYWLDGVGAEYLQLMLAKIKGSRFKAEKVSIAAARLPSTTANNCFDGEKIIKRDALDKFAHESFYRHPFSICKELQIVQELMDEILSQTEWRRIAIVSDHGLTALSRLLNGRNHTKNATHEGREEEVDFDGVSDGDYIFTKSQGKSYRVALKHASLGAKPVREVHGGCTPEEVLVPFVVISRQASATWTVSRRKDEETSSSGAPQTQPVATVRRGFEEEDLF
ncbi:MAG: BREX-4 system phosphatase PglZ [Puniceicoccales bacterium]|jgi:hypothetical protein|nr:BREX-4 system phosphatase PglZ [Puniceicoccales bacterium]